jgi:hypothetical protein
MNDLILWAVVTAVMSAPVILLMKIYEWKACVLFGHHPSEWTWAQDGYNSPVPNEERILFSQMHGHCRHCKVEVRTFSEQHRLTAYYTKEQCAQYGYEFVDKKEYELKKLLLGKRNDDDLFTRSNQINSGMPMLGTTGRVIKVGFPRKLI